MNKKKALPALALGILFVVAGFMKLFIMGPAGFSGMLQSVLGMGAGLALASAWLVALGEFVGGIVLLGGKVIPTKLRKFFIVVLIIIMLVAIVSVDIMGIKAGFDGMKLMDLLRNIVILAALISVCPCAKSCGTCTDGTCSVKK